MRLQHHILRNAAGSEEARRLDIGGEGEFLARSIRRCFVVRIDSRARARHGCDKSDWKLAATEVSRTVPKDIPPKATHNARFKNRKLPDLQLELGR
jgi:hypothetical protein